MKSDPYYKSVANGLLTGFFQVTKQDRFKYFQQDETGLYHPYNDSVMRIYDDGNIDIFSARTMGMRIDIQNKSTNLVSPAINLFGRRIHFAANKDLLWNFWKFNPKLRDYCEGINGMNDFGVVCEWDTVDENGEPVVATKRIPPYIKDKYWSSLSLKTLNMAKDFGYVLDIDGTTTYGNSAFGGSGSFGESGEPVTSTGGIPG